MAGGSGKAQTPAPIDRPLARAYLRQFKGWSTAYPPGMSDPASVRVMENVQVARDGALRVRPGLRYLSYLTPPSEVEPILGAPIDKQVVGTHEAFFLDDGSKAYLFAVRETDLTVGFRVLQFNALTTIVRHLTDAAIGFTVPQTEAVLNFTAATTYVKYMQIDNKIYALSNAGETMRRFTVGTDKSARKLTTVNRPNWTVADKLTVLEPEAAWISAGTPTGTRTNLLRNPKFETGITRWALSNTSSDPAKMSQVAATASPQGTKALRLESLPTRTNLCKYPLHNTVDGLETGWAMNYQMYNLIADASGLTLYSDILNAAGASFNAVHTWIDGIVAGQKYQLAFDLSNATRLTDYFLITRWYTAAGAQIGGDNLLTAHSFTAGRKVFAALTAPAGAVKARLYIGGHKSQSGVGSLMTIKNVVYCKYGESTNMFHGGSGANYFWTGAAGASTSVYHPPVLPVLTSLDATPVTAGQTYTASVYVKAVTTVRDVQIRIYWCDSPGHAFASSAGTNGTESSSAWTTRRSVTAAAPAGATSAFLMVLHDNAFVRGEYHDVTDVLFEKAGSALAYFDGDTVDTTTKKYDWGLGSDGKLGTPDDTTSIETTYAAGIAIPTAETPTTKTLISDDSVDHKNVFNVGMFYTFSNEIGETWSSQVTVVKVQRSWAAWRWETANAAGEPSGTATTDPTLCADQLVAVLPQAVFDQALIDGAIEWSLYMMTWSDQDVVPVTAVKVDVRSLKPTSVYGSDGWGRMTPQLVQLSADIASVPVENTRYNFSEPSSAGQGLVAADRMIMVLDPSKAAVIKWSSNQQGDYDNFTASRGGGYKTLTSGNLNVPACVKLWQNPQSTDTLTILCLGTDGRSASYYMAPASVSSQSEATSIMGFEETTSTPGTTSPYGVEVFANALYHPIDESIVKSSAHMYNLNHMPITDLIAPTWKQLQLKINIVSSQHNSRLYYIVYNPLGAPLEAGCRGNEIWVYDAAGATGTWSRFLIQALSLREIEQGGRTYMSVVRPDGLYYLDPNYPKDDAVVAGALVQQNIPWRMETNTQGANRAHDAWCHFRQAGLTLGNFDGSVKWGVRGVDVNGKLIDISKVKTNKEALPDEQFPTDQDDFLFIDRTMQQWTFYASSTETVPGVTDFSRGQINFVQYRYAPISVNVGYEYGSVETFEYGRSLDTALVQLTDAGVPSPAPYVQRP